MANPAIVKQSLTPPDFTELGASKLADLLEKGFVITGVCFERQVEGTQPQRGFVDFAGFVGWWRPEMQQRKPLTEEQRNAIYDKHCFIGDNGWEVNWWQVVDEVESAHGITVHGVADMKGSQNGTE